MSDLLRDPLIMSVKEFRKLTGKDTAHLSDEDVERYISNLDFIAQMFVASKKSGGKPMSKAQ